MRIKTSGTSHILYRYSGSSEGKGVESKIGSVPVGTAPDALSEEITDNLTPREARELREHLATEQVSIFRSRFMALLDEVESVSVLVIHEKLDVLSVQKMAAALSSFQSVLRRVQRAHKASVEQPGQVDQPPA